MGCAARSRQGSAEWVSEQRARSIGFTGGKDTHGKFAACTAPLVRGRHKACPGREIALYRWSRILAGKDGHSKKPRYIQEQLLACHVQHDHRPPLPVSDGECSKRADGGQAALYGLTPRKAG